LLVKPKGQGTRGEGEECRAKNVEREREEHVKQEREREGVLETVG